MQRRLVKIERDLLGNKPLRDCLRQCVSLGGDLRSARLRDWAMKELMGYQEGDEVPSYRMVTGLLLGDAQTFHHQVSGMAIPWTALPDGIREHVRDTITLPSGVATLEENVRDAERRGDGSVKIAVPMGADIAQMMSNDRVGFERLYWGVTTGVFRGVLDEVRTTAVSVLAEVRSGTPATGVPTTSTGEVADQAVNVIVYGGKRHTFNVITSQSQGGDAQVTGMSAASTPTVALATPARRWWAWAGLGILMVLATVAAGGLWLW
ncbi:hypothetical protein [Micromonospora zamorensis]|uniref:AbiTii domain-containing protein n=1 Tax=Micromonospora zamorensis TaxID=709883 RepID=UPI0033B9D74B